MLTKPSKRHKAQSAMEYLMTYGWAILIIAVVLGALFSLGVFSGANLLGTACIAQSGFLCQTPIYSHTTGEILVSLGQNTGTSWYAANFTFVPQGTALGGGGIPQTMNNLIVLGINANGIYGVSGGTNTIGITSGQTVPILLPINSISTQSSACPAPGPCPSVGTTATGAIWAEYQTIVGGPKQYIQIASINIKAS